MEAETVVVPRRSLIVLCGPTGAGKSTFARDVIQRNDLASTALVSSDACRLMLCDDLSSVAPDEWPVLQLKTFDLFVTIVGMRVSLDRPTIADGVNLYLDVRPRLRELARTHGFPCTLVVFDMTVETCLLQNTQRSHRMPAEQIRDQRQLLDEAIPHLAEEEWDHVVTLNEQRRMVPLALNE